ncbi:hypothetical protein ACIPF8_15330, partial [Collimonas sp. NPDC087041]|uniref:hypothetical protein n=1 Tax=Collimonas sp. NPDC087041 TaxID=3363960 RepID=UPI0037F855CA
QVFRQLLFYYLPKNFLLPTQPATRFISLKLRVQISPNYLLLLRFISRRSQREANYSNPLQTPQVLLFKFFKIFRFI